MDAAAALMAERGVDFTVDELARRADVARRTVFNHFASLDDVVLVVCSRLLSGVVDEFLAAAVTTPTPGEASAEGSASISVMFDEVVHALVHTDLVGPMAYLTRVLGDPAASPGRAALLLRSVHDLSADFALAMAERHPEADPLDVQLLVNALMSGLMVLHPHWLARTGGADDDVSRAVWDELVQRLVAAVREGYRPAPAPDPLN